MQEWRELEKGQRVRHGQLPVELKLKIERDKEQAARFKRLIAINEEAAKTRSRAKLRTLAAEQARLEVDVEIARS